MTSEYGKPIRTYRGKAVAKFSTAVELPCRVYIQQVENGRILVRCLFSPSHAQSLPYSNDLQIERLTGDTDNGLMFETRGKLFRGRVSQKASGYHTIDLLSEEIVFRRDHGQGTSSYRFNIVNFEFIGNGGGERQLEKGKWTIQQLYRPLNLSLPWGAIAIHPVPDYEEILKRVKSQKGIAVTSEALITEPRVSEFPQVIEKVDELCHLLSLARGTKINWVSAETIADDGSVQQAILKHCVTWPFSSLTLIDYRNPNETPIFVEKSYPAYIRCRDTYNLDIAIDQYLDAKRETAYLDARGLAAVALIDSLQQSYASQNNIAENVRQLIAGVYLDHKDWLAKEIQEEVQSRLKEKDPATPDNWPTRSKIKALLKNVINADKSVIGEKSTLPGSKDEELLKVLQKIPEFKMSFREGLKIWTHALGLEIPDHELEAVKDTRNSLAHKLRFKSTDEQGKVREYFRLINLINQIFLKSLKYSGYYIHVDLETLSFERQELV